MILNQENISDFFRTVKNVFRDSLATNMSTKWSQVATRVPSTTRYEDYGWIGEIEDLREWLGPKVITRLKNFKYTLENRNFERTYAVHKYDLADDVVGVYMNHAAGLARAAAQWQDQLVFEALANGITENCYDGQPFFDTQHPVGKNTTSLVSNLESGGGGNGYWYLMDTRRSLMPLILQMRQEPTFTSIMDMQNTDVFMTGEYTFGTEARGNAGYGLWQTAFADNRPLTAANFREDRLAMRGVQNDEGREMGIDPNVIVVGRSNEDTARDLFGLSDTTDRGTNTTSVNPERRAVDIVVVPWLP